MGGGLRQSLKFSDVKRLPILIPPPKEQTNIAAFLDRETGKIDALVEEQELLIELLKEKRQAVISHAVTKGLNLDVPMKDSGIDWIGEVPSHWEVLKFTREVKTVEGQVDPKVEPYSSMNLIGPEHVESKTGRLIELATALEQSAESGKYLCLRGHIVYSKIRPALGKVVIAPEDCLCSADMYPFDGIRKVQNQFLFWLLLSAQFVAWSVLEADRVAMPKINRETFRKLHIPVPPQLEQGEIAEFLNAATADADNLIAEADRTIELLQERRSALISAAVTGQIDVRNFHPQEATASCQ
jgi:type I restriction enzyme S subunit